MITSAKATTPITTTAHPIASSRFRRRSFKIWERTSVNAIQNPMGEMGQAIRHAMHSHYQAEFTE